MKDKFFFVLSNIYQTMILFTGSTQWGSRMMFKINDSKLYINFMASLTISDLNKTIYTIFNDRIFSTIIFEGSSKYFINIEYYNADEINSKSNTICPLEFNKDIKYIDLLLNNSQTHLILNNTDKNIIRGQIQSKWINYLEVVDIILLNMKLKYC